MERAAVELQANDSEYDDGEQHEEGNLQQRSHGQNDSLQNDLQTCTTESERTSASHVHKAVKRAVTHWECRKPA